MKVQSTLVALSLLSLASALPTNKRDSSINEPAVAAPNGTPITLTGGAQPTSVDNSNSNSMNCPSGDCKSNMNDCMNGDCNSSMTMSMNDCKNGDCSSSMTMSMNDCMNGDCSSSMTMSMNDCMSGNCDTTSMMSESSTMMDTMTMATNTYTSMATAYATNNYNTYATNTWTSSSSAPTYGSGYSSSSYDGCVQQCMASYAPPPSMVTATPSYPAGSDMSASGTGATHTVIVAPTQGVLRYVPFAVNASIGDTVRFVWGAGPHTVTKSSQFNLCNATMDKPFKSGVQNKSFVFDQVVNDTNPTFYYCGVPNHCEKGMFGIINPPSAQPGASSSATNMMQMWAQNNSDVSAQWQYTVMNTQNSTAASAWGWNMDVAAMTTDPQGQLAILQNFMFTRLAMASNDKFVTPTGGFNPDIAAGMAVPMDPLKISASNATSPTPSSGANNAAASPSGSTTASSAPSASSSGAASKRIAMPATAVLGVVAIAALAL